AFPDRGRPVLALGLRTAGSYFAPLVCAWLKLRGYRDVEAATLRPKTGVAPWEQAALARCATRQGLAVVVDEPANTGATLACTSDLLARAGVPPPNTVLLLPVHPTRRDWNEASECLPLLRTTVITLEPEQWHKHRRLDPEPVAQQMQESVAARVKRLGLPTDPQPELDRHHLKGMVLLAGELSRAFGSKHAGVLKRARLCRELARRACPVPTLIDAKMRLLEWVQGPGCFLKTDFEHHGMGKTELNLTDPAYDLAETSMNLGLSAAEERVLIQRYRQASGDEDVEGR